MTSTARRTKYAADQDRSICMLLDVRGNARDLTLQVWSPGKGRVVGIARYRYGTRTPQISNLTPENKRWCAVTVPAWYRHYYGLFGYDLPAVMSGFCRQRSTDTRTDQEKRDDAERELAQFVVDRENRYRRLPGQRLDNFKGDRRNANIMA